MRHLLLVSVTGLLFAGCKPPPPAPEGLTDSARYMLRNFFEDDATFGAGITVSAAPESTIIV